MDNQSRPKITASLSLSPTTQSYANWQAAEAIVQAEGMFLKEPALNSRGEVKGHRTVKHPAIGVAKDEKAAVRSFGGLFGLDPMNRTRVVVPPVPEKDLLQLLLDGDIDEAN